MPQANINVSGPQKNFADILEMSWIGDTGQDILSNNSWINALWRIRGGMKIDSGTSVCVCVCVLLQVRRLKSSGLIQPIQSATASSHE